ncbi:MAG: hypothetical protein QM756_22305 [Polyangiaceae bacterium]
MKHSGVLWLSCTLGACRPGPDAPPTQAPAAVATATATATASPTSSAVAAAPAKPTQLDDDGDDDPSDAGSGEVPERAHFELVGRAPLSLQRICDLTPLGDSLFAAHANAPLGSDGASISRYSPSDGQKPFRVAFDWNRPGEPSQGGGAGQGFLRVHRLGARLFVPDADPPYYGFWLSRTGTEGFVFVSDAEGQFARARMPGHLPPALPNNEGKPGAALLPNAYHVLDVIRYRGRYYASTGAVPPGKQPNYPEAPGALYVADTDLARFQYAVEYPHPRTQTVTRLTFMTRFRDRLYAGIQDFEGQSPHDFLYFEPARGSSSITQSDLHAVRITPEGSAATYRWYTDQGKLYWIAATRGGVALRVSDDGDQFRIVELPAEAGVPTDIVRFRDALVVLCERALLRLTDTEAKVVALIDDKRSPFALSDFFCAAPLAVFQNELYAGGQQRGELYRLVAQHGP